MGLSVILIVLLTAQLCYSIQPVWSEHSLSAWRKLLSLASNWAHSESFDQTVRMPRLIWVFTVGAQVILFVLSCRGSNLFPPHIDAMEIGYLGQCMVGRVSYLGRVKQGNYHTHVLYIIPNPNYTLPKTFPFIVTYFDWVPRLGGFYPVQVSTLPNPGYLPILIHP